MYWVKCAVLPIFRCTGGWHYVVVQPSLPPVPRTRHLSKPKLRACETTLNSPLPPVFFMFKSLQNCISCKPNTWVQSQLATRNPGHCWAIFETIPETANPTLASNQRIAAVVRETVTKMLIMECAKGKNWGSISITEYTGRQKQCVFHVI